MAAESLLKYLLRAVCKHTTRGIRTELIFDSGQFYKILGSQKTEY